MPTARRWISVVFFLSGFAALIYQVVWQRSLYALFGINVESVTLVVTAFLLGIGAGSLLGGLISRSSRPLVWFAVAEGAVGVYGLFSLDLFQTVSARIITAPGYVIGIVIVALLILPTVLMGMTLPLH
jgi:predicted membrane-bound spermidine synthase